MVLQGGIDSSLIPTHSPFSLLACCIIVFTIAYLLINRFGTPLRKVPGPFLASISQLWIVKQQRGLQRPHVDLNLHRKYGPIVRIAPNEVLVSSPASKKIIYGATSKFTKAEYYCATGDCGWDGNDQLDMLPELDMEKYKLQRRIIGSAYSASFMQEVEPNLDRIMETNIKSMIDREGLSVNIDTFFNYWSSDCVQMATFGESLGFVESNADCGATEFVHKFWYYMHWVGYLPWIHRTRLYYIHALAPKVKVITSLLPSRPKEKLPTNEVDRPQRESIFVWNMKNVKRRAARKEVPSHPTTIADRLYQIQSENPALKQHWLASACQQNFNAGVETVGVAISTFLNYMMSTPGCQERLQKEVDDARAAGKLSAVPKVKELDNLPYFKACLSESKRLHPPIAHPLSRIVPQGGVELEGYWLPAGTTVGINPWVLSRDKSLYGEDADEFRPERWLEFSPEHLKTIDAHSLYFGSGTRACPGQYLATAMLSKTLPLLVMNLEWHYTEPDKERKIRSTFMTRLETVMVQWKARAEIEKA